MGQVYKGLNENKGFCQGQPVRVLGASGIVGTSLKIEVLLIHGWFLGPR